MSWVQSLVRRLPANLAADIEAKSRAWKLVCRACGHVTSYWEIGGIRWKAAGNPHKRFRCAACGRVTWHRTEYHPSTDEPPADTPTDTFTDTP